jgi:carbonic anhydrase/acetyltransferase-like protein (isoleucine patch superfamily)
MPLHAYRGFVPRIGPDVFIAAGAQVIGQVTLHEQSSVWFNAVMRADINEIILGARSNIQDNCTVHVEDEMPTVVGEDVTIGHGVTFHGCTIERQVLIGMNAVLLSGCRIGSGSIIGANALVTEGKEIPPRSLVLGSPGRIVREITDQEFERIVHSASHYVELARHFRSGDPLD